ncbi:MAG: hypothetical protein HW384_1667 [Dehalococcoidia bacterium]|nr:hypothetical protein [Dehalococcoidia bacterium]
MPYIEYLEIDDPILEKIESKHQISFTEVREACLSEKRHVRRGKKGRYKVFSQTEGGRYVIVILLPRGGGDWKVITARDMTDIERRLYSANR